MTRRAQGSVGDSARAIRRSCADGRTFIHALCCVPLLLLCACAPMSEQELFERDDRLNLAKEEFGRREASCRRMGGTMIFSTTPLAKTGYHDYKSARCVSL